MGVFLCVCAFLSVMLSRLDLRMGYVWCLWMKKLFITWLINFKICTYSVMYFYTNTYYRQTSNIRRTWVGNKIVDYSDIVGASAIGAAPMTSSFST